VDLADETTGTLAVGGGGTGATALAANRLLLGGGAAAVSALGAGNAGQVLASGGSSAPAWQDMTSSQWTTGGGGISYTAGSVGIGTASPASALHVDMGSAVGAGITLNGSDSPGLRIMNGGTELGGFAGVVTPGRWAVGAAANDLVVRAYTGSMLFATGTTERMRLTSGGSFGIGTTSPAARVEAALGSFSNGSSSTAGVLVSGDATNNPGWAGYRVALSNTSGNYAGFVRAARTASTTYIGLEVGSETNHGIRFLTNGTGDAAERMRIDAAGAVGIGTAAPAEKLHVAGTSNLTGLRIGVSGNGVADFKVGLTNNDDAGSRGVVHFQSSIDGAAPADRMVISAGGSVGIGTTSPVAQLDVAGTGSVKIPVGTTAQRPSPVAGMVRFNSETGRLEFANGTSWNGLGAVNATGGTTTTELNGYRIHTFNSSGSFTVLSSGNVEVLVVAGGGGGGGGYQSPGGGGGGGGGVLYSAGFAVVAGTMSVTVGAGGAGGTGNTNGGGYVRATSGGNSVFGSLTAIGGEGGGNYDGTAGLGGGSGGGGSYGSTPGTGTSGQGYAGGGSVTDSSQNSGGGGGAGGVGGTPSGGANTVSGIGGPGVAYSISGTSTYYGGGGSAGQGYNGDTTNPNPRTPANTGGGGTGGRNVSSDLAGGAGTANTGGGGGGAGGIINGNSNSTGGSGIVIIRYPL